VGPEAEPHRGATPSTRPSVRTALATFGYGRPAYFERMLRSLGACPEVHDGTVDILHFLDGGRRAEQRALVAKIEASRLPCAAIVARSENLGIGRQLIGARREIFEERGYDRLVLVEDDVELGPTYLTALLRLADWAGRFDDVGTVQAWNVRPGSREELAGSLADVVVTHRHFVTYCIGRHAWERIAPTLYEYERRYLVGRRYRRRPHWRIRHLFMRRHLARPRATPTGRLLGAPPEAVGTPFPRIHRRTPTSQDAITSLALHQAGLVRLALDVPRAHYFGVNGVHCTPEIYAEMGFDRQGHHVWTPEEEPRQFRMKYRDEEGRWLRSVYR